MANPWHTKVVNMSLLGFGMLAVMYVMMYMVTRPEPLMFSVSDYNGGSIPISGKVLYRSDNKKYSQHCVVGGFSSMIQKETDIHSPFVWKQMVKEIEGVCDVTLLGMKIDG